MFINSLQTLAPERMFLSLCYSIQQSYQARIRKFKPNKLYMWPVLGWDATLEHSNAATSAQFNVFDFS